VASESRGLDRIRSEALAARLFAVAAVFTKVGVLGFGGGYVYVRLLQHEVEERGWLDREGFVSAFALANALPGPLTTKLAGFIGYRLAGWGGAAVALTALVLPSFFGMVLIAGLYLRFQGSPVLDAAMVGVRAVVVALIGLLLVDFVPSAVGSVRAWRSNRSRWALAIASVVLAVTVGVPPAALIVAGGLAGFLLTRGT
jgi:chromate transporter